MEDVYYINQYFESSEEEDIYDIFEQITEQITTNIFTPVAGMNDLGVNNSITFMDPMGKYMDVKDVKGVSLFGNYYGIVKTAVYDYQWNNLYITNDDSLEAGRDPLPPGWYKGDPSEDPAIGNANVVYEPTLSMSSEQAWAEGWVYRVGYTTAGQFVPTLKSIYDSGGAESTLDDMTTKARNTEYTFYRLDINDKNVREALHMNPAYGSSLPDGVVYDGNEQKHLSNPGVYALADMRIWVEDTGDYNDDNPDLLTDANYDEALWVNLPANMLPLREITINEDAEGNFTYETNIPTEGQLADMQPYSDLSASFPLRVYYTVGVSDDVLGDDNRINVAQDIAVEYTNQNKASTAAAATARNIPQGSVEFFSNWYNPLNRYNDYATNSTDYTFGDPVTTFSPAAGNRYYMFQKALPLYSTAYVWVPNEGVPQPVNGEYTSSQGMWRRVRINESAGDGEVTFLPTDFGGRLLAQDLVPTGGDSTNPTEQQTRIWDALEDYGKTEGGSGITTARAGDIILLKNRRLDDVSVQEDGTDPFPSAGYFYLAIDFYNLKARGQAEYTQYVIARKGSEFGSAYKTSGISNGEMLVWHDVSGTYTQDYPYLSLTDTGDKSRGRDWIGWPLDANGYYVGCDKNGKDEKPRVPSEGNYSSAKDGATGEYAETWEQQKEKVQNDSHAEWVLCAKPGGLRVGGLSQAVQGKGGGYSTAAEQAQIKTYYDARYTDPKWADLTWGFYDNNVTRTANNYYLPTISTGSTIEDVRVNTYLGNNGRLYVMDTTLLVTKLIEQPYSHDLLLENEERFDYQVFIEGVTGPQSAVVVKYNGSTEGHDGSWQRQFHYIDLQLDDKLLLQTSDGQRAIVAEDGCRLIPNTGSDVSEPYVYAMNCTSPSGVPHAAGEGYDGPVYYVYMGKNTEPEGSDGVSTGSSALVFRVYHNRNVDEYEVSTKDVTIVSEAGEGSKSTFYAAKVYLVPVDTFEDQWSGLDPIDDSFDIEGHYSKMLEGFELLTIDPTNTTDTSVTFTTPYLTASAYWTETVYFGYKPDEVVKFVEASGGFSTEACAPAALAVEDLFDQSTFADQNNLADIAASTAQFQLINGYGLLFSGVGMNAHYRATEKITEEQLDAGYTLKSVYRVQQESDGFEYPSAASTGVYSVTGDTGAREESVNFFNTINKDKTETQINGKDVEPSDEDPNTYPAVKVNDEITYKITWTNGTGDRARVVIIDPLDKGVDFVGATTPDGGTYKYFDSEDEANNYLAGIYKDVEPPVEVDSGHVVIWVIENTEKDASGFVELTVKVNGNAAEWWDYDEDGVADKPVDGSDPGNDFLVRNRATVRVADNAYNTNTVVNPLNKPSKTETNIEHGDKNPAETGNTPVKPDDLLPSEEDDKLHGPTVFPGDKITYEIEWNNYENKEATITIRDPLDPNVKFVSASFDPKTFDPEPGGDVIYDPADIQSLDGTPDRDLNTGTAHGYGPGHDEDRHAIEYIKADHTVTYNLGVVPAGASGKVTLVVQVLDSATPVGYVDNTAYVTVGQNDEQETDTIENPTPQEEKTEVTPGDGVMVKIGEQITYQISWQNYKTENARVIVMDTLDPGVTFVSADGGEYTYYKDGGTLLGGDDYDDVLIPPNTVVWNLGVRGPLEKGQLTLTVTVNEEAFRKYEYKDTADGFIPEPPSSGDELDYEVLNQARVKVDNDDFLLTQIVENPIPDKNETKVNHVPSGGTEDNNPTMTPKEGADQTVTGPLVYVGDEITYTIHWTNGHDEAANVIIRDPLDPGVDLVEASFDTVKLTGADGSTIVDGVNISYDDVTRTVTWILEDRKAKESGEVTLVVKVTEKATPAGIVDNQASVKVGTDPFVETKTIENPTPHMEKTEVHPGEGMQVMPGDEIDYKISWHNYETGEADVIITDKLDPGVDFVSAGVKGNTVTNGVGTWKPETGNLTIMLRGGAGVDDTEEITFTLTLIPPEGKTLSAEYQWENSEGGNGSWTESSRTVQLKPGQQITVKELPVGTVYSLTANGEEVVKDAVLGTYGSAVTVTVTKETRTLSQPVPPAEPVPEGPTEPSTEPSTEGTTEPSTEPSTEGTTEPSTEPSTEGTSEPTESSPEETTGPTEPTGEPQVDPGLEGPGMDPPATTGPTADDEPTDGEPAADDPQVISSFGVPIIDKPQAMRNEDEPAPGDATDPTEPAPSDQDGDEVPSGTEPAPEPQEQETVVTYSFSAEVHDYEAPTGDSHGAMPIADSTGFAKDTQTYNGEPATIHQTFTETGGKQVDIYYFAKAHVVVWVLHDRPANVEGEVDLKVRVNADAEKFWSYDHPEYGPDETTKDDRVRNQAGVQVGENPEIKTRIIENPTEPEKTETHVNDRDVSRDLVADEDGYVGPQVNVGDTITYRITWQNNASDDSGLPAEAEITITDVLDPGVEFVDASEPWTYDPDTRTVTWNLGKKDPRDRGVVTLTVRVLSSALDGENTVENQATVTVGNKSTVTKWVENPVAEYGGLTVTKTVKGDQGDTEKLWHFTVRLEDPTLYGDYGDMTFNAGIAEFTLQHGESRTATGLPAGTAYTVEETEANKDGYTTSSEGATGTIPAGDTAKAAFVNSKSTGPDPHKTEVTPGDKMLVEVGEKITYEITWQNYDPETANVVIRDPLDDGVDFVSASEGYTYDPSTHTVTWTFKADPNTDGVVSLTVQVNEKAKEAGIVYNQAFVTVGNHPEVETEIPENPLPGGLIVTKVVTGTAGDTQKEWHFRVELSDKTITGQYGGMFFTDGVAEFTLKHGQSLSATRLPDGITYTVTELESNQDGYTTRSTGAAGTIQEGRFAEARFVNGKDRTPPPPTTPTGSTTPTTPDDTPKTGDSSNLGMWLMLLIVSLVGVAVTFVMQSGVGRKAGAKDRRGKK